MKTWLFPIHCTSNFFPNSLKSREGNWDFWSPLPWFHLLLGVFQAQLVCRRERRIHFMIKLPVFKENVLIYITPLFAEVVLPPRPPNCIWNKLVCQCLTLLGFFPICKNILWIFKQLRFFFASGVSPILVIGIFFGKKLNYSKVYASSKTPGQIKITS